MTGSSYESAPELKPAKPPADIRTVGRWHQWATFGFLIVGIAAVGLAWLLGYLPNV